MKPILFSLEQCQKCDVIKNLITLKSIDVEVITLPHEYKDWSDEQKKLVMKHGVLNDLQITAPVLVLKKQCLLGQLAIKKWIDEEGGINGKEINRRETVKSEMQRS